MKQKGRFYLSIKSGRGKIEPSLRFLGFTLIELLIVLVIVGILVSFAVPQFAVTKERALDREAKATLGLMRAAERIYKMEEGSYYPSAGSSTSDIDAINTNLKLSLPAAASGNWTYSIDNSSSTGICQAARSDRTWTLNSSGSCENPACNGAGCFEAGGCS